MKNFKSFHQHRSKNYTYADEKRPHIKKEIRERVMKKYGGHCYLCGFKEKRMAVDHVNPWAISKDNSEENLSPICLSCNNYKGIMTIGQLRNELSKQVERARTHSLNFRLAEKFQLIIETGHKVEFYFERFK